MEQDRIKLYQGMVADGNYHKDIDAFNSQYFSNDTTVKDLWKKLIKNRDYTKTLKDFYTKYACDLSWAKKTTYCGGGNTNTSTWDNFPCVVELAKSKGVSLGSDNSYEINGFKYFTTGYKYNRVGKSSKFKCDDPQFIKHNGGGGGGRTSRKYHDCPTGPYTQGCKSEVIRKVQGCIGVKDDSFFGPKTQGALESKGFKNGFTDTDVTKLCSNKPEETKVEVILPDWASCLKVLTKAKVTQDSKGEEIVVNPFGPDSGYFWKDNSFLYLYKDGTKTYGKWSCKNNSLFIKLDDGNVWTLSAGWGIAPDKTDIPDKNFDPTWVDGDEFSSPSELPPTLNQNESAMDNLENIINEVNSLINEQTQQAIQIPMEELNVLTTNPFLKDKGTLVALCRSQNGTSRPVNVNGKIYFAAKQTYSKSDTTKKPLFITYDGMILEGGDCKYTYSINPTTKSPKKLSGVTFVDLDLPYTDILLKFGIDPKNYDSDPYFTINSVSADLKNLAAQGAVSNVFKSWNDMLRYYHPQDYANYSIIPLSAADGGTGSLNVPTNRGQLANYIPINGRNYGLTYNDKDVQILFPKDKLAKTTGTENNNYDQKKCETAIKTYLAAAIRYETHQDKSDNSSINNAQYKEYIKGCDGANMYETLTIVPDDLPKVKKDHKIFNFWRGKTLNIRNVYDLLAGRDKALPAGQNPYLPFTLDGKGMNESKTKLSNLIKENLQKLSEEKNSNLLAETKIIQTRTKILTENRILKFKQPREKFFNEIISEAIYLESQGFDKQLIKEEFWDTLKGMFGQHGSEAIFGTFKEYMGKWLLKKLTPVNPDGWIGSIIVAAIGNLHINDLSKLTDCNFLTKKLASSIGEGVARKIQHDKGYDGGISDIVRNGLFSAIDNTQMVQSLESGLAKLICPALSGVKTKIENKAKQMKTMAVQA